MRRRWRGREKGGGERAVFSPFLLSDCLTKEVIISIAFSPASCLEISTKILLGAPADVAACFRQLQELGPNFRYHPSSSKSWCICSAAAEPPSRDAFASFGLSTVKWCRGHHYVGGLVGSAALRDRWVEP